MNNLTANILTILAVLVLLLVAAFSAFLFLQPWNMLAQYYIQPLLGQVEGYFNPSATPTITATSTATFTPTITPTSTASPSPTPTFTHTPTSTATFTSTPTLTDTPTSTATFTLTPTETPETVDGELPDYAFIEGYESWMQGHNLSCEARVAVDFARYFGVEINENDFLDNLPRSDDPNLGFVGDIDGPVGNIPPNSYGVYADPVANLLRDYGLDVAAVHGMRMRELKAEIAAGRPVMAWVVGAVEEGYPQLYYPPSGGEVTVVHWEHVVAVVGYDQDFVYVIDPTFNFYYGRWINTFKSSWAALGNMAVIYQAE